MCAELGLLQMPRDDHAAYLQHWLAVLKADKRAIFSATAHAQRAADYLTTTAAGSLERTRASRVKNARASRTPARVPATAAAVYCMYLQYAANVHSYRVFPRWRPEARHVRVSPARYSGAPKEWRSRVLPLGHSWADVLRRRQHAGIGNQVPNRRLGAVGAGARGRLAAI